MSGARRPESVLVVVYTKGDQVLLLKRVEPFAFWQSVTGSLDAGETAAEAARRELAEETGIVVGDRLIDTRTARRFTIDPRWRDRYPAGITENLEHEFRLELAEPRDIRIDPREHSAWRWVPLAEAVEQVWSSTNREALASLRDRAED